MSLSHHSAEDQEAHRLFMEQLLGTAKREWPQGRIAGEDDGALAFAIAADHGTKRIIIRFPKAVDWLGLTCNDGAQLRNKLDEKIGELTSPVRNNPRAQG